MCICLEKLGVYSEDVTGSLIYNCQVKLVDCVQIFSILNNFLSAFPADYTQGDIEISDYNCGFVFFFLWLSKSLLHIF